MGRVYFSRSPRNAHDQKELFTMIFVRIELKLSHRPPIFRNRRDFKGRHFPGNFSCLTEDDAKYLIFGEIGTIGKTKRLGIKVRQLSQISKTRGVFMAQSNL